MLVCGHAADFSYKAISVTAALSAVDDAATALEDNPATINVLANDKAAGLKVYRITQPSHGQAALNPNGTIKYTPAPDFFGPDSFTYTLCDASPLYYPGTGHYYEYVSAANIDWFEAEFDAAIRSRSGMPGYLATITSAGENAFIVGLMKGSAWLGGTDQDFEGVWEWVLWDMSPEAGKTFWNGGPTGKAGQTGYANWNTGEPNNNYGAEHLLEIIYEPGTSLHGKWNDVFTPYPSGYPPYSIGGYIVEYGDSTSPPKLASATVRITVNPVNDAPIFIKGADPMVSGDSVPQSIPNWATSVSPGPPDEAGQSLSFQVANDNNALFSIQPSISPNGTLTFTPAPNANGKAAVTVLLKDNGGTANGGIDASSPQTFMITVQPMVYNVHSSQRSGAFLVDITYDLADSYGPTVPVSVRVSDDGGATYDLPAMSFTGDVGGAVITGTIKKIVWDAGKDWPNKFSTNMRFRVTAQGTAPAPMGMALIPAGSFVMGDAFNDGSSDEMPAHVVQMSAFYMGRYEVTKAFWEEVRTWAVSHGYGFDYAGSGKADNHPVQTVNWHDAVKWCNARSEMEGRAPAYYTDSRLTLVYRTGQATPQVNWNEGYRLPTEAEWEKAGRSGTSGRRFSWGDTISHSQANYNAAITYPYDLSYPAGYHPAYASGGFPYTSPVGSFGANAYGLYDMEGNVWEWCWDWYTESYYASSPGTDPRGPDASSNASRVVRGGRWDQAAWYCRAAFRGSVGPFDTRPGLLGFRFVLPTSTASVALSSSAESNVTVVDTRTMPVLAITDAANLESIGELGFGVYLSQPSSQGITVQYATTNDTAIAGTDYEAASGVLTFSPGQTNQTVKVRILDNPLSESDRSLMLLLSNVQNALLADGSGTGIIIDDDPYPQVLINDAAAVQEGGKWGVTFNVGLTDVSGQAVQIDYFTANGSALAGRDYAATNGTLVFTPGQTNRSIVVPVLDSAVQGTRNFSLILTNAVNGDIGDGEGIGVIIGGALPEIRISDIRVKEGNVGLTDALFSVALSRSSSQAVSVDYYATNGTATASGDYQEVRGTFVFDPGTTNGTIHVLIMGDTMNEPDEFFMVQLAHAVNADIAIGQARGTVENDDPEPTLLVAPAKVAEGDAGLTNMVFRLLLSTASSREVTVNYATADGAAIAGEDYEGTNGVIKFAPGVTRLTIDVAVKGDFTPEPDELFFVNLTTPVNARIVSGQGQASGVIQNDDLLPLLSISDGGVTEPVSGGANAILIVRLSSASSETVTVEYATTNGTALAGKDYAGQSGILTMPPGATTTNVSIQILADGKADGDKAFYVQLRNPTKAVLDDAFGQVTLFQSGGTEKTMTLGVRRISQNKLELYLTGLENQSRQIQASYDLMDWQTITNATGSGWSMPLPETPSTQHSYRFYKAVSP